MHYCTCIHFNQIKIMAQERRNGDLQQNEIVVHFCRTGASIGLQSVQDEGNKVIFNKIER